MLNNNKYVCPCNENIQLSSIEINSYFHRQFEPSINQKTFLNRIFGSVHRSNHRESIYCIIICRINFITVQDARRSSISFRTSDILMPPRSIHHQYFAKPSARYLIRSSFSTDHDVYSILNYILIFDLNTAAAAAAMVTASKCELELSTNLF